MSTKTSAKSLLDFLDRAAEKGWLNKNTATGYRAACQRILEIENDWEEIDVSALDVDDFLQRFVTLKGTDYTPGSLQTYKSRFRTALETFLDWAEDPSAWKPPTTARRRQADAQLPNTKQSHDAPASATRDPSKAPRGADGMISYPFPLRNDVDVELVLPRDLTPEEAKRLVAFVNALAIEEPKAVGG